MVGIGEISHTGFISLLLIDISIWTKAKNIFTEQQADVVHNRHVDITNCFLFFNRQGGGKFYAFSREHTYRYGENRSTCPDFSS